MPNGAFILQNSSRLQQRPGTAPTCTSPNSSVRRMSVFRVILGTHRGAPYRGVHVLVFHFLCSLFLGEIIYPFFGDDRGLESIASS